MLHMIAFFDGASSQLSRPVKVKKEQRKVLVYIGFGAGWYGGGRTVRCLRTLPMTWS